MITRQAYLPQFTNLCGDFIWEIYEKGLKRNWCQPKKKKKKNKKKDVQAKKEKNNNLRKKKKSKKLLRKENNKKEKIEEVLWVWNLCPR